MPPLVPRLDGARQRSWHLFASGPDSASVALPPACACVQQRSELHLSFAARSRWRCVDAIHYNPLQTDQPACGHRPNRVVGDFQAGYLDVARAGQIENAPRSLSSPWLGRIGTASLPSIPQDAGGIGRNGTIRNRRHVALPGIVMSAPDAQ